MATDLQTRLASRGDPVTTADCEHFFGIACYQPSQIRAAYDLGPLAAAGIDGTDQSIAVVDAFGSPTIAGDLATFDLSLLHI